MADTNIDEIFNSIEKDFVKLSANAARSAANKAQKNIREKADRFIDEYYASYQPKWYRRKYALYKLVQNYYKEKQNGKGLKIEFGVTYDASRINGLHKSNSWWHQSGSEWISRTDSGRFNLNGQDNGIPSPEWITNNFLEGIHPSGKLGDKYGIKDSMSPDDKMQKFFDTELGDLVGEYMNKYLLDAVASYF